MQRLIILVLIVIVFLAFMVSYTVRFTEKAVVTTFGKADAGSVITEPGLRFKLPYFQQVTKYDARARYLESNQETQQTADESPILVTAYMTWRVDDPLKFFRKFSASGDTPKDHYKAAEQILKSKLRSAMGEVSRYRFGELLAADEKGSRLAELEQRILDNLGQASGTEGALADYGIKADSVGITRMGLPQNATRDVFQRMNEERKKIADAAIAQGEAQAQALRSGAESDAKKIQSFADRLAQGIRGRGDIEAAEWFRRYDEEPRLAVFLEQIRFMRDAIGNRTTLVMPTSMPGMELLQPNALRGLKAGDVPGMGAEANKTGSALAPAAPETDTSIATPEPSNQGGGK